VWISGMRSNSFSKPAGSTSLVICKTRPKLVSLLIIPVNRENGMEEWTF
jgi:hypothetical protein